MSATIWVMDFNKSLVVFYLTISPTVIEIAPKLSIEFWRNLRKKVRLRQNSVKTASLYFVPILLLEPIRH